MGNKLDALLRRNFKTSKFKALVNLAISRLAILKNHRQGHLSVARSDVVQLLNLGHHERALLRVEQVVQEQNMLDVLVMIEGYCFLLIERVNLIEQEKVCPDELKEASSSMLYASTRCGEFPELQEIRDVFTLRFGKEFASRAIELSKNCGVNPKMIQKLSTRQQSLESRLNALEYIASENGIVLQIEKVSSVKQEVRLEADQKQSQPKQDTSTNLGEDDLLNSPEKIERVDGLSDSMKAKKKYRDVTDAAQAAFESAAYAAAAASAAVELSRSESRDPDDQNDPSPRPRKVSDTREPMKPLIQTGEEKDSSGIEKPNVGLGFEKIHRIQNYYSESEEEEIHIDEKAEGWKQSKNMAEFKGPVSVSSSDSADNILKETTSPSDVDYLTKLLEKDITFDESDDEIGNEQSGIPLSRTYGSGFNRNHSSLTNEALNSENSNTAKDESLSKGSDAMNYNPFHKQFPLGSQAGLKAESRVGNSGEHYAEGSKTQGTRHKNAENRPVSARTRRQHGP